MYSSSAVLPTGEKGSRFWNVSGVDADLSLSGAKVKLEAAALVNGAIAFDSPADSSPAAAEDTFGLYADRRTASAASSSS